MRAKERWHVSSEPFGSVSYQLSAEVNGRVVAYRISVDKRQPIEMIPHLQREAATMIGREVAKQILGELN